MLLSNEVTWKLYCLDRKERELESGRRWNNVSTAQSLLNILRNFSFHGIRLDDRFHYQLTLLYHHHWSLYKAEKDWRESMDPKHLHKFQMTTSYKIHVLSHNSVLRVSSVSKNPMTSYGLTMKHLPLSQPVVWGLQLAMWSSTVGTICCFPVHVTMKGNPSDHYGFHDSQYLLNPKIKWRMGN